MLRLQEQPRQAPVWSPFLQAENRLLPILEFPVRIVVQSGEGLNFVGRRCPPHLDADAASGADQKEQESGNKEKEGENNPLDELISFAARHDAA
ncbi:MAG: hypothetical protein RBU25_21230 [Lentisphaeria bacterium]|nr:hypothetical protein [Lentisphaeria bacterium]